MKVFYISNRTAEEEEPTKKNLERLGFPMGGAVDTMLMTRKQPDWGSAKGTRRAFVAKSYRILINVGDNFGDFGDDYRVRLLRPRLQAVERGQAKGQAQRSGRLAGPLTAAEKLRPDPAAAARN